MLSALVGIVTMLFRAVRDVKVRPIGVFTRGDRRVDGSRDRRWVARPIAAIGRMYVYTVRSSYAATGARPVARLFTRYDRRGDRLV